MTKYRKKPVIIEARLWEHKKPQDAAPLLRWIREEGHQADFDPFTGDILIDTLEGVMRARSGDYILQGVQGEFYPCKPDIFEKTYELVED